MKTAAIKPSLFRRPLAVLVAALLVLGMATHAPAQSGEDATVLAHGTAARLYVGMSTGGSEPQTWIQYRTGDQPVWRPFAQLEQRAVSLVHVGGEVVVLLSNGDWRLIWDGGDRAGPRLPDRRHILALGGDGRSLYAVGRIAADAPTTIPATTPTTTAPAPATQPTHTVGLWIMQPAGWSYVVDLPADLDPHQLAQVQVIARDGQPILAVQRGQSLRIIELVDQSWQTVAEIDLPPRGQFKLIATEQTLLWTADETGPGQLLRLDVDSAEPIALAPPGDLSQPTARNLATFNQELYLVFADEDELAVQGYESSGALKGELDTLGPPYPLTDPRISELLHLVVLAAMLFVLVTTLRQRKLDPISPESMKQVQLAPFMPRFLAGLIDVSPFLVAMGWVIAWAQTTPDPAETLVQARSQWPVLLATALYIVHTLIGEVFFGRSFGKWCLKLRIAAIDGHPPTPTAAAMRNLLRIIDLVVVFPLPLLLVLYTPLRQRIGDIAARTMVIRDLPDGVQPPSLPDEASSD